MELATDFTGQDVTAAEIVRELARLRGESSVEGAPTLRTSMMTHLAWVPRKWLERATAVLEGMGERHPSRTILLVPEPDAGSDGLDADLSLECFPLAGQGRHVCAEVVQLTLRGRIASAPASVVAPLLVADLPVFCRWRGEPPFGTDELEQMVGLVDRLVVDSSEWDDLPYAYTKLQRLFEQTVVSDIAWSRTLGWRRSLAARWPGIADLRTLKVAGPQADALLLAAWLRTRLDRDVELRHDEANELRAIEVDGEAVEPPPGEAETPSDLLSNELDRFGRDRVYEETVRSL